MRGMLRIVAVGCLLAASAMILLLSSGRAQDTAAAGEKVHFRSVDGVDLHGTFYASDKGQKAPAVMVIHDINESSRSKEYADLAKNLQKEGFSVLTFDLRGHGQSTTVDPAEFWSPKYPNRAFVKGAAQRKETIEQNDMPPGYYSVFVNDIAAAKAYLDKRNDNKECNSSSLILIGAGSGATLGAVWINSEWHRYKMNPSPTGIGTGLPEKTPEGKSIICGFWLSITPALGSRKVSLASELYEAAKAKKVPMVFVYNKDKSDDKSTALGLIKAIKGNDKKNNALPLTVALDVQAGSKLTGRMLLKQMDPDNVSKYLKDVQSENGNDWQEQDARKSQYMWKTPIGRFQWAKQSPVDSMIRFSTYNEFIR